MTRRRRFVGFGVVALVLLFVSIKLVNPSDVPKLEGGFSDAPFGPFAGYAWIGRVHSVGASFAVPRIANGSPLSLASTWIGAQGAGPPARFVQIGAIEERFWSRQSHETSDFYYTFWSDTARHFKPQPLFPVSPGDALSAELTLANKRWTLAISDDTSRKKARFSTGDDTNAPSNQASWTQEDPGSKNDHARYPQIAPPVFQDLTVNSAKASRAALYSEWMSVNHSNLAPTALNADSFTLKRAPAVSAAAAQYLRLSAAAADAFDTFETERTHWNVKTPYKRIATATSRLITAAEYGIRALLGARWSKPIQSLVRSSVRTTTLEHLRPPSVLTPASFSAWNSKLTQASERAAPAGAKLRLALGLPAFGPSYDR